MLYLNAALNYTFNGLGVPVDLSLTATFTTLIETPPPSSEGTSQLTSPSGYNWSITLTPSPCSAEFAWSSAEAIFLCCRALFTSFVCVFCRIHMAGCSTTGGLLSENEVRLFTWMVKVNCPIFEVSFVFFTVQHQSIWVHEQQVRVIFSLLCMAPSPVPPLLLLCSKVLFACSSSDWIKLIVPQREIDGKAG